MTKLENLFPLGITVKDIRFFSLAFVLSYQGRRLLFDYQEIYQPANRHDIRGEKEAPKPSSAPASVFACHRNV